MRVWAAAGLAVVTAALGAGAALLVAGTTGLGEETTTVVVDAVPATGSTAPSPVSPIRAGRFDPQALYASRADGVVTVYASFGQQGRSQGSGFVVDRAGVILTNAHVVTNIESSPDDLRRATAVYVEFTDGERVQAELVGWDLYSDVGVLRVSPADHPVKPVPLGASAAVRVGQPVAAIGSPFGQQGSLSVGVVSAIGRSIDSLTRDVPGRERDPDRRADQPGQLRRAAVRRGRARDRDQRTDPEPVGDGRGRRLRDPDRPREAGARPVVADREGPLRVHRGQHAGRDARDRPRVRSRRRPGRRSITRVEGGTPAAAAGLRGGSRTEVHNGLEVTLGGDLIVAIAGAPVQGADDVSRLVTTRLEPGQTVPFTVLRAGRKVTVDVRLGDRPDGSG